MLCHYETAKVKSTLRLLKYPVGHRARLWHKHCGQMPRAYEVEGAHERWLQYILKICQTVRR